METKNKRQQISKKLRFEVFKRDNFTCQYCGRMAPDVVLEIDHMNPVKNGGDNNIMNLVTSCFECNRGKGKRKLTEQEELKKQQDQLKLLNEKRKQLQLMIKWKKELEHFDNEQVNEIEKLFEITNTTFTEEGKSKIKSLIKKYGFDEVYESTKLSINQYYNEEDENSTSKVFNYIARICNNKIKQKENPKIYKINYLIKIACNRLYYVDKIKLKLFLNKYFEEDDFETLKVFFKEAKNWTELIEILDEYYEVEYE